MNQVGPLWSLLSLVVLVTVACAPESDLDEPTATPVTPAAATSVPTSPHPTPASQNSSQEDVVWRPSPCTNWQWQLTGDIDTSFDVQMYDIDFFDAPQEVIDQLHADGRVVICYFSAGSWEDWRSDANQFTDAVKGEDNGWPGEKWLDIRKLDVLGPIMESRLDLAVKRGAMVWSQTM